MCILMYPYMCIHLRTYTCSHLHSPISTDAHNDSVAPTGSRLRTGFGKAWWLLQATAWIRAPTRLMMHALLSCSWSFQFEDFFLLSGFFVHLPIPTSSFFRSLSTILFPTPILTAPSLVRFVYLPVLPSSFLPPFLLFLLLFLLLLVLLFSTTTTVQPHSSLWRFPTAIIWATSRGKRPLAWWWKAWRDWSPWPCETMIYDDDNDDLWCLMFDDWCLMMLEQVWSIRSCLPCCSSEYLKVGVRIIEWSCMKCLSMIRFNLSIRQVTFAICMFANRYGDFPSFGGSGPDPQQLNGPGAKEYLQVRLKRAEGFDAFNRSRREKRRKLRNNDSELFFMYSLSACPLVRIRTYENDIFCFNLPLSTGPFPRYGLHHLLRRRFTRR